ncbi:winged helix-turn-helix domain-containing protein [Microbulbifer elongatus]|uniref:winged helix-turn-helix domain-containing protein n=1 Tax=Microbulbifer elongatus TaxID=86173 RepID=UPI001E5F0811|nr:winged helix-turn-helix domain-containing protein [Microbulbifer elongatus]
MQYRFDRFVLDLTHLRLTANGQAVDADARQLQLLGLLIAAYPECLSRQSLLDQLWPETVVSQWSLGRLVSDTRKLFRELAFCGELIETQHGRGYRLAPEVAKQLHRVAAPAETGAEGDTSPVAQVRSAEAAAAPAPDVGVPSSQIAAAGVREGNFWRLFSAVAVVVVATALVVYQITARRIPDDGAPLVIGEAPGVRGRILWVDDNPDNNLSERRHFESRDIAIYLATNTEDAMTLLSMYRYDAVISDMGRGEEPLAGFKLMERIRGKRDDTPYFLYTIMPSKAQRQLVEQRGGNGVAVTPEELYGMVLPLFDERSAAAASKP